MEEKFRSNTRVLLKQQRGVVAEKKKSVIAEMDGRDLAVWRATYKDGDFERKQKGEVVTMIWKRK